MSDYRHSSNTCRVTGIQIVSVRKHKTLSTVIIIANKCVTCRFTACRSAFANIYRCFYIDHLWFWRIFPMKLQFLNRFVPIRILSTIYYRLINLVVFHFYIYFVCHIPIDIIRYIHNIRLGSKNILSFC